MKKNKLRRRAIKKLIGAIICAVAMAGLVIVTFTVFFDQAVLVRKNTIFHKNCSDKVVALTFDDGPSLLWTPQILDELKKADIKATFFMIGQHVEKYPQIAQRVSAEGHEIGNHTYDHHVLLNYKMDELEPEIRIAQKVIQSATGQTTRYFRPPKAWINNQEKKKIKEMGYEVVLWSLNSKDWVTFHDKQITSYILRHIRPGDIILFHDSGGIFITEGGDRSQTVKTIPRLVKKLKARGYRFVTITELLTCKN